MYLWTSEATELYDESSPSEGIEFSPGRSTAGIQFRRFRGDDDFAVMSDICVKSWEADYVDFVKSSEDFKSAFEHDPKRDPARDLLFAEVRGRTVAFAEIHLTQKSEEELRCNQYVHVLPDFRGEGLREALLRFNEKALRHAVRDRPRGERRVYQSWALSRQNNWQDTLLSEGYGPTWHVYEMVRPNLDDVPDFPLPEGLSMHPIAEGDYRKVWDATRDAFIRMPWSDDESWDEAHYRQWLVSPLFTPDLWQIAWDGDEVVGSVQNFIDYEENKTFGRARGHTERIFVAPSWRGKGLAKALISRSLLLLKEKGMTEATLDTEEANVHQAYRVYEKMGFRIVKQFTFYRKSIA
ncbi:MAG: GNAT family N-acetyltransferase [Thermoplasmata archaeon]|nr:GNAT family N-acetyltransferase [Thermoplasmata archaeon]